MGGFGGYDPNDAPVGYDANCWRATNWDTGHGLQCYSPYFDTLKNTYNTLTPAQKAQADAILAGPDPAGGTMLLTNPRAWLPWTWDFGAYPPPSNSLYTYLGAGVLPWPGKLTGTQSRALYAAVAPRVPNLSNSEFLTILAKVKADNPENPNVIEWTPADPTPKATTTFTRDDGSIVTYDGTYYTLPDGTKVGTAAEAGLGPSQPVYTPPPTISGSIPPGPTSNTNLAAPTTIPVGNVTALPPVTATGGQTSVGSAVPQISPAGSGTTPATVTAAPAATPAAPKTPNVALWVAAAVVVLYLLAE